MGPVPDTQTRTNSRSPRLGPRSLLEAEDKSAKVEGAAAGTADSTTEEPDSASLPEEHSQAVARTSALTASSVAAIHLC